jgi:hypothetical protein
MLNPFEPIFPEKAPKIYEFYLKTKNVKLHPREEEIKLQVF